MAFCDAAHRSPSAASAPHASSNHRISFAL
ncbi:Uncharacterised protein [Vibrio cholerae]|nr:Uncharacterised protein [Vibrio cholerae]